MEPPRGGGRHRGALQDGLLFHLPVSVAAGEHLQRGADGRMSLNFTVDGFDLVEDIRGELDVQMVRHHGQYEPVTKLEDGGELLQYTAAQTGRPARHQLLPQSPAEHRAQSTENIYQGFISTKNISQIIREGQKKNCLSLPEYKVSE